jgi:hypothetical protein
MAFGLAAYVSRCWLPVTAQGWLPGAGQALLDGLLPAGLLQKVFNSLHVRWPPFPSFLAQSPSLSLPSFSLLGTGGYCWWKPGFWEVRDDC